MALPARGAQPSVMARRGNDGGNSFMDFVWGVIMLLGLIALLLEFA